MKTVALAVEIIWLTGVGSISVFDEVWSCPKEIVENKMVNSHKVATVIQGMTRDCRFVANQTVVNVYTTMAYM